MARVSWNRGLCSEGCDGCRGWRARFLLLWIFSGILGSLWFSCGLEKKGRDLEEERILEQFSLTKSQLRSLTMLLSSLDQKVFNECIDKSLSTKPYSSSYTLEAPSSNGSLSMLQHERMEVSMAFHDQCPIQDGYIPESSKDKDKHMRSFMTNDFAHSLISSRDVSEVHKSVSNVRFYVIYTHAYYKRLLVNLSKVVGWVVVGILFSFKRISLGIKQSKSSSKQIAHEEQKFRHQNTKCGSIWRKKILVLGVLLGVMASVWIFVSMNANIISRRKETLTNMCDERARMLQDQFNVSMNHVHALGILVSTFHHGKDPSAINQTTFAEYTARTAFERPLTSGVAYALKVPHSKREEFEKQHGWRIKKMETEDQSPVQGEYMPEMLDPSPDQPVYAPVIFSQETVSHIVSIDMMSGKEDRENIMRASATGKGVLTSPFNLLKSNHLGVVLTFAVYNSMLPLNATPEERIDATLGYLGASFDVPSLVERLLQQLASKQTIIVNVYDTTNSSATIKMYGPDVATSREMHVSGVDFGDPDRKHEMHCRFKQEPPIPWAAITISVGVLVIVLLVGHIFHAAINRIEKVEDDYHEMRKLKVRAEAADVAKSQFLATVSHEIRTPMNGVLGMLQMLMDTDLDATQQDFAMTAQSSGKALITLINEVLDLAKIESGRLELEAVPFDVRDVLDNVISLFSDKSRAKGIELAVYISDRIPEVLIGDPGRFRQIITNLVGNSVKFTEQGHIFVSVHLVEEVKSACDINSCVLKQNPELIKNCKDISCITLSGFPVVGRWNCWENFKMFRSSTELMDTINLLVAVEDTGVGIPQDAQNRIFMPFMQADSSTSRTYGGTGIGLSISKCLVDLMSGEMGFVSKPSIGSTFAFTAVFSEGRMNAADIKRHQSEPLLAFRGMKGLVVDGRCIRAEITRYHLQRLGMHVDIVVKSEAAVSLILEDCQSSGLAHLDMVLVDKEAFGEGSGLAFVCSLTRLMQNERLKLQRSPPKIILLAISLSPIEIDELKLAGVDSAIKPLRLNMMVACLQRALGVGNKRQHDKGKPLALQSLLNGKHILVVDDNAVNRKVAAGALKKYGAIVTCVDNGKAALRLLQPPHKFDACFMDVQMPEMDGFEATKQIRRKESDVNKLIKSGKVLKELYGNVDNWHVPILAMTADVFQATHDECVRCGMDDYVSKPLEEEQLYSAVSHFFEYDKVDQVS